MRLDIFLFPWNWLPNQLAYATYKISKDLFLGILLERRKFFIFLQYEFFSFSFCFFLFFPPLCLHTYTYESSCWLSFKAHRLVNKHDTKDSNELKEDHNINYSVGFGVWAQFRDKFLMHGKLLNSDCSIAYSFCFFFFLDTGWRENLWAPFQCWSIGLYVWLVSYFLFEIFYLFSYQLWMPCAWV